MNWSSLFSIIILFATAAIGISSPIPFKPVRVEDQFKQEHFISFPRDKPVILTMADQKAADLLSPWISGLKQEFGTDVHNIRVADVRKVPSFLRSYVRSRFEKKYSYPVLLDWSGALCSQVSTRRGEPGIYLFSGTGILLAECHGDYTKEKLQGLALSFGKLPSDSR